MESVKNFSVSLIKGFIDSLRGVTVLLYLDKEINEKALSRSPHKDAEGKQKQKAPKVQHWLTIIFKWFASRGVTEVKKCVSKPDSEPDSEPELDLIYGNWKRRESKVLTRVLQSCILNGFIFLLSILVFEYVLLPSMKYLVTVVFGHNPGVAHNVWGWMQPFLSMTFRMIWVLPLFLLSKLVNSLWFQDIADSAYRHRRGRPQFMSSVSKIIADSLFSILGQALFLVQVCYTAYRKLVQDIADSAYRHRRGRPQFMSSVSKIIADSLFSILVQALFLVQSMLVSMLPITYIGELLCLVHMCLLYSLYSFEYKWFNMGWELHKRLTFIETNWPYFLGFGLPLAVLTQIPQSYIISGCVFSIFFPVFILSGNEATPVIGSEYPLRLFSPVVAISNGMFRFVRQGAEAVTQRSR
ncbi:etoposide-induced protein 2.4 homolog isoform X2 [Cydia amplana]|uniref:etoposide-induced protein 2.4 homolog isoform X2 n=1 Tax=Cydia amplana TaxID=1869771 RepID=UPI002FE6A30D